MIFIHSCSSRGTCVRTTDPAWRKSWETSGKSSPKVRKPIQYSSRLLMTCTHIIACLCFTLFVCFVICFVEGGLNEYNDPQWKNPDTATNLPPSPMSNTSGATYNGSSSALSSGIGRALAENEANQQLIQGATALPFSNPSVSMEATSPRQRQSSCSSSSPSITSEMSVWGSTVPLLPPSNWVSSDSNLSPTNSQTAGSGFTMMSDVSDGSQTPTNCSTGRLLSGGAYLNDTIDVLLFVIFGMCFLHVNARLKGFITEYSDNTCFVDMPRNSNIQSRPLPPPPATVIQKPKEHEPLPRERVLYDKKDKPLGQVCQCP